LQRAKVLIFPQNAAEFVIARRPQAKQTHVAFRHLLVTVLAVAGHSTCPDFLLAVDTEFDNGFMLPHVLRLPYLQCIMEKKDASPFKGPARFAAAWLCSAIATWAIAQAADRPVVSTPRATSGDTAIEPDWSQRLTITVGPGQADLVGTNARALQAAVDYVARLGGGTVRVLPGTYRLRNAILQSRQVGVLFRDEKDKSFAGHRNRIENNRIVDSGSTNGVAIDVQGATEAVVLSGNEIIETRQPADRIAVRLGAETKAIQVVTNQISGFALAVKQVK